MRTYNTRPGSHSRAPDAPLLVSVPEAARLLGVGTTFGWALVHSGEIPSVKLGRRVLVPRAALERVASRREMGEMLGDADGESA